MTPTDEDMKVAREVVYINNFSPTPTPTPDLVERVARALASQREACAQKADAAYVGTWDSSDGPGHIYATNVGDAIRAGKKG